MISKIIQKEKERQEVFMKRKLYFDSKKNWSIGLDASKGLNQTNMSEHKQSLINLKEYLEGEFKWLCDYSGCEEPAREERIDEIREDIAELTKMIEAYK